MDTPHTAGNNNPGALARPFEKPMNSIGPISTESAATLIAKATDITLVMDDNGLILDMAIASADLARDLTDDWTGRSWESTVTVESRSKIKELLSAAVAGETTRPRQVNHPVAQRDTDIPVLYSAMRASDTGRIIAVGRSLTAISALQQRLVDAQQSMERGFSRMRHLETRYRLLFQVSSEPVLIVDAATNHIIEANPAAAELLGLSTKDLVGQRFPKGFDSQSTRAIETLLGNARSAGRAGDIRARRRGAEETFLVSASLFRQESASLFLVRLRPDSADTRAAEARDARGSRLLALVQSAPDAFVVTDTDGQILTANPAFVDMTEVASDAQVVGQPLERWLGRPGVDLNVLLANLRQHGSVRLFSTTVRSEYGVSADVELSAVSVAEGDLPCFGFMIRNVSPRLAPETASKRQLPRSVEQLTELVGQVSLKELVRETTDVIERLCIEAALELTENNRASAAEMLGLSRQSLYVKLRRYGMSESGGDADD